jgi:hypothetical protein
MAEQRTKEIGVRKVLGAPVFSLVYLLSAGITKLILIAICIAIPLSWYAVNSWLAGFAYHINVSWLVFFIASAAALGIAWLTVRIYQRIYKDGKDRADLYVQFSPRAFPARHCEVRSNLLIGITAEHVKRLLRIKSLRHRRCWGTLYPSVIAERV